MHDDDRYPSEDNINTAARQLQDLLRSLHESQGLAWCDVMAAFGTIAGIASVDPCFIAALMQTRPDMVAFMAQQPIDYSLN